MHDEFLQKCRAIVGENSVLTDNVRLTPYTISSLGLSPTTVIAAIKPATKDEISQIVLAANTYRVALYPISIGSNWGYGSKTPPRSNCVVLDLSQMNNILRFDAALGIITVEPGVKTSDVEQFLKEKGLPFMAPVIGAGPHTSMIGNMLDKGISSTPFHDRLSSLVSLEAVLPDGSIYTSDFIAQNIDTVSPYKWGVGPYLDGLFVQSNLGIVTKASFYLARKPAYIRALFIPIPSVHQLDDVVATMHELRQKLPGNITSFQIEGPVRTYAHYTLRNKINLDERGVLSAPAIKTRLQELGLGEWSCCAIIQGEKPVVLAAQKIAKKALKKVGFHCSIYSRAGIAQRRVLVSYLPKKIQERFNRLRLIGTYIERTTGAIGETNGWLPVWRNISISTSFQEAWEKRFKNIDTQPECGFLFFVAAFPAKKPCAHIVREIEAIARKYSIDPLCGLLEMPGQFMHFSLQMTYDRQDPKRVAAAFKAYEEIFRYTAAHGVLPYRVPHPMHHLLKEIRPDFWPLAQKIKKAIDPDNIISPGRYIPDVE